MQAVTEFLGGFKWCWMDKKEAEKGSGLIPAQFLRAQVDIQVTLPKFVVVIPDLYYSWAYSVCVYIYILNVYSRSNQLKGKQGWVAVVSLNYIHQNSNTLLCKGERQCCVLGFCSKTRSQDSPLDISHLCEELIGLKQAWNLCGDLKLLMVSISRTHESSLHINVLHLCCFRFICSPLRKDPGQALFPSSSGKVSYLLKIPELHFEHILHNYPIHIALGGIRETIEKCKTCIFLYHLKLSGVA